MSATTKAKHARLIADLVRTARFARTHALRDSLLGAASALALATYGRPLRLTKADGFEAAMASIAPNRKDS